jgi:hypothetical protein
MSAGVFYLSFVDESRPVGDRFVGATIVYGEDAVGALDTARSMGLVPKGVQVAMVELYTQNEKPQRRITTLDMLPIETVEILWGRIAARAELEAAGGAKPLTDEDADAFVCSEHANP